MGVTDAVLKRVREAETQEEGEKLLAAAKATCKEGFHTLALKLHPDRTGDDENKTKRFKFLKGVYESFKKAKYKGWRRARPTGPYSGFAYDPLTDATVYPGYFDPIYNSTNPIMMDLFRMARARRRWEQAASVVSDEEMGPGAAHMLAALAGGFHSSLHPLADQISLNSRGEVIAWSHRFHS